MINTKTGFIIYIACLAIVTCGMVGFMLYDRGKIFPPKLPQNLEELHQWPEKDLSKLNDSLKCSMLPWENVPEDLLELKRICDISTDIWHEKYKARKLIEARDGLKHLHK